ncbi:MAG: molecular chaperone TorD family protein [Candidatus Thiodiazotropha lotti]|nr:molecular chaperone TorD family protein [Candidatus Thiodiazotropha lotti]
METDWKVLADSAKSRSDIYGLLSAVFREEPTETLIKQMKGPQLLGAFTSLGVKLGERFYTDPESEVVEQLAIEYSRLFIGPGPHISPHESIFIDAEHGEGGLWGVQTVEVKKFIETTGLDYDSGFCGIPDHVSVELEFMQKLSEWEADKWLQEDRKSAEYCLTVQRMFLEKHLLCWLARFCDEVMDQAQLPFYRAIADLTKTYMEFEKESIAPPEPA